MRTKLQTQRELTRHVSVVRLGSISCERGTDQCGSTNSKLCSVSQSSILFSNDNLCTRRDIEFFLCVAVSVASAVVSETSDRADQQILILRIITDICSSN